MRVLFTFNFSKKPPGNRRDNFKHNDRKKK